MKSNMWYVAVVVACLVLGAIAVINYQSMTDSKPAEYDSTEAARPTLDDYKNIAYRINGELVSLVRGYSESDIVPNSAAKTVTQYFGNELFTDLNGDGVDDVAFLLTQETGGSGVFYYAVAALYTESGYLGSDAYLLGDRIAPQPTSISPNPRHRNVVVFNYVDRGRDESMSAEPSVGKSVYLKIDPETNTWAIVEPDFEGESAW